MIIGDIDVERAASVGRELDGVAGGRAHAAALDITSAMSISRLIESVHARFGGIHGLVNNAYPRNANYGRKLEDVAYADFCENTNSHLGGYFLAAQQVATYMRGHGGGSIVNMASVYGVMAPRFEIYDNTPMTMPVEYAAIKSSIIHLTKYFAKYYRHDGIRVNTVSPGGIFDNQPSAFVERYNAHAGTKGMLGPDDIAGTIAFLLSDDSRYMTGQNLVVDDGFSL